MRILALALVVAACGKDSAPPPEPERWALAQLEYALPLGADTTAVLVKGAAQRAVTDTDVNQKTPYEAGRLIVRGRREAPNFELPSVETPRVALGIDPKMEMESAVRVFTAAPSLCPAFLAWSGEALAHVPFAKDCPRNQARLVDPSNQPVIVLVEPSGIVQVKEPGLESMFNLAELAKAMRPTKDAGASRIELRYTAGTQLGDVLRAWDMLRSIGFDEIVIASKPTA